MRAEVHARVLPEPSHDGLEQSVQSSKSVPIRDTSCLDVETCRNRQVVNNEYMNMRRFRDVAKVRDSGNPAIGREAYAITDIKQGEKIYMGEPYQVIPPDMAEAIPKHLRDICYECWYDDKWIVCPIDFNDPSPSFMINHACDPNVVTPDDWDHLIALRDVHAGEAITEDYATTNTTPLFSFSCHCGSPQCRGTITADDWRRPELQERYCGYFAEEVQKKIDAANK